MLAPNIAQAFVDASSRSRATPAELERARGCGTVIGGLVLLAVGYALLREILPYLIGGVVLLVGGAFFFALANKVGFGKALLICGLPAVGGIVWLSHATTAHNEQLMREMQEATEVAEAEEEVDQAAQAAEAAAKRAAFRAGYPELASVGAGLLPKVLLGPWQLRDAHLPSTTDATISSTMIAGINPPWSGVRFRLTSDRLLLSGAATHRGEQVVCGGAFEPVGLGDKFLVALGCQNDAGTLRWSAHVTSAPKLDEEMKRAEASTSNDGLIPPELRGVWLSSDASCPSKDRKRRTVITSSMILGTGGNDRIGVFQIRVLAEDAAGVTFQGMTGSWHNSKPCTGRLEDSGAGAYTLSIRCDGEYGDDPTQLCKKATSWIDL